MRACSNCKFASELRPEIPAKFCLRYPPVPQVNYIGAERQQQLDSFFPLVALKACGEHRYRLGLFSVIGSLWGSLWRRLSPGAKSGARP